jgi:hypothetical protein
LVVGIFNLVSPFGDLEGMFRWREAAVLKPGWDDDLKAFVKSWTEPDWLSHLEIVRQQRWDKDVYVNLQALCGNRLAKLPDSLSRGEIFDAAQGPNADVITAFLWTMAWGHSGNGTGAERTNRIVANPNSARNLAYVIGEAQRRRIQAAFVGLHGQHRLVHLATSFGPKLIYFAGFDPRSETTQPLIFDKLVEDALSKVIDPGTGESTRWNSQTKDWRHYWEYCDLVRRLRNHYVSDARIDMVEHWLWLLGGGWCWHHAAIRRNGKYPVP